MLTRAFAVGGPSVGDNVPGGRAVRGCVWRKVHVSVIVSLAVDVCVVCAGESGVRTYAGLTGPGAGCPPTRPHGYRWIQAHHSSTNSPGELLPHLGCTVGLCGPPGTGGTGMNHHATSLSSLIQAHGSPCYRVAPPTPAYYTYAFAHEHKHFCASTAEVR